MIVTWFGYIVSIYSIKTYNTSFMKRLTEMICLLRLTCGLHLPTHKIIRISNKSRKCNDLDAFQRIDSTHCLPQAMPPTTDDRSLNGCNKMEAGRCRRQEKHSMLTWHPEEWGTEGRSWEKCGRAARAGNGCWIQQVTAREGRRVKVRFVNELKTYKSAIF